MLKPLFLLLSGAVYLTNLNSGASNDWLIAQTRSASRHVAAPVAETTRIRTFTVPPDSSPSTMQTEFSGEALSPYNDHAALPAGAVYTTSDDTA